MMVAGHSLAHLPQPTQRPSSTCAAMPFTTAMAPRGHTLTQQPQATQALRSTTALRAALLCLSNHHTAFLFRLGSNARLYLHYICSAPSLP